MQKKTIAREAAVLLLAALMAFSSLTALANTNTNTMKKMLTVNPSESQGGPDLIWDNTVGVYGGSGGVIVSVLRPDGDATPADDFVFGAPVTISAVFWQGGYFQCELAQGFKDYGWNWNIIFWTDSGNGNTPGAIISNQTVTNSSIEHSFWYEWTNASSGREYWVANYSAQLPVPVAFDANTKYWVTIQGVGAYPPQACWSRHNETVGGIKLHQAVFKGALWSAPNWENISVITWGIPHDLNFQLYGQMQNAPPVPPTITGPVKAKIKVATAYNFTTTDPNGDDVSYFIDWGDGTNSSWIGPYSSGMTVTQTHTWTVKGTYVISAKAKDSHGNESDWGTLSVSMPSSYEPQHEPILLWLFERFPHAFPILRHLLGY